MSEYCPPDENLPIFNNEVFTDTNCIDNKNKIYSSNQVLSLLLPSNNYTLPYLYDTILLNSNTYSSYTIHLPNYFYSDWVNKEIIIKRVYTASSSGTLTLSAPAVPNVFSGIYGLNQAVETDTVDIALTQGKGLVIRILYSIDSFHPTVGCYYIVYES